MPVKATFTGVRGLPWWFAVAYNNANPALAIGPSGMAYRVLRRSERPFPVIEAVDFRTALMTVQLLFLFRGALLTFSANVADVAAARQALAALPDEVELSSRAAALLRTA